MAYVTPVEVARFLGADLTSAFLDQADEHAGTVTALVRAYTRGGGFDPATGPYEDVAAVIVCAVARLLTNPEQLPHDVGGVSIRGGFNGFNLAEQAVLNRYRRRTA